MRLLICSALAVVAIGTADLAHAAQPASHGCVGSSVSALATERGVDFGAQVSGEAVEFQGVGEIIAALAAGQIPDSDAPNDCN